MKNYQIKYYIKILLSYIRYILKKNLNIFLSYQKYNYKIILDKK